MMRISAAALGALVLITGSLGAQQPVGVVSNALVSPVLPDIVAVERAVNARQELQFIRLSNQRMFQATRMPTQAGQLDWRPVADQGRSWFAYVASDETGRLALMLNYLDATGELSQSDPIRIPFGGQVRTPRWSHNGEHLAFVSDSGILHIVPHVADALRSAVAARNLRPVRVSAASTPALFPAWSPSGDQIAYGTEVVSGGMRNGAIEVLPINPTTGAVAGVPIVLTGELSDDNETRPSWSRDGKHIAFYAQKTGEGAARQPVSIGIVEVVLNPRTGQSYRGIVKEGSQRWLADDVIPNDTRGPAWTSVTEGSQRKDAVVYVQRDAARMDPIVVADLQRWLGQIPRNQYETAMTSASDAANPGSVSVAELNKRVRSVFTVVQGGNQVVTYRDAAAPWAQGPEPVPPVVVAATTAGVSQPAPTPNSVAGIRPTRGQDVGRALLFPGLGQFSAGRPLKGGVLAVAGGAGAVLAIMGKSGMSAPLAAGKAAVDAVTRDPSSLSVQQANYDRAKSDFDAQRSKVMIGGAMFATAWLYGILDAAMSSPPGLAGVSMKVVPDQTGGTASAKVGFSVAVGHSSRGW